MKKRLTLIVLLAFIGGLLYVPFIKASVGEVSSMIWFLFPLGSAVGMFVFGGLGLKFLDKSSLKAPIMDKWELNQPISKKDFSILIVPLILGVTFALVTFGLNQYFDAPKNPGTVAERMLTTLWAGVITETISHLFVMTGIFLIVKNSWISIFLSSLIFLILFHLNGVEGDLNLTIYLGAMNFIGASLTGWIYMRNGFESAVTTHLVMHIIILGLN